MFAYVSILDAEAMNAMKGDVMTGVTSFLGIAVAVAAVGLVIKALIK